MNKLISLSFLLLSFVTLNSYAEEELVMIDSLDINCTAPNGPIIPDGNVASEDELVSAQNGIKSYQAGLSIYRLCLADLETNLDPVAESTETLKTALKSLYDASIDAETAVAEKFNLSVRAFKERQ